VVVRRARPYVVLDHPELAAPSRSEDNLSFFSGHSSAVFCAASFVARDLGDALRWRVLAGWDHRPVARSFLAATPYLVGYGVASVVGVSRIVDQQHWATDVLLGAVVGTLTAHLTYVVHFDQRGRPRRRLAEEPLPAAAERVREGTRVGVSLGLVPTGNGLALAGLLP
jgi:membrane-associated phospholipid phosphatase